jgi:HD-like signal output (HDOD) protein
VRFILSGQCQRETVMKTVGLAHQFFTKPCDSEALRAAVLRACGLMDRLADPRHKAMVAGVRCVPSSPLAVRSLWAELESAEPSAERLGRIVSRDVGMTAKLLQLVSSGFFGSPQKSSDPVRWAAFLGIETLRLLVSPAGVVRPAECSLPADGSLSTLGKHSRRVADGARAIAAHETDDPAVIGHAYLAGLLHDVGHFVFADQIPHLGTTHADVGACLLALWGVPKAVVDAVAFHHCPSLSDAPGFCCGRSPDRATPPGFSPLIAVHVADAVATADALGDALDARWVDSEHLARMGCADRLDAWCDLCRAVESREVA